jgi:large subunit ribosomal protein L24
MATATPKAKTPVRIKMRIKKGDTGRIVTEEASLHASNVMLYSTDKQVASRVEIVVEKDGTKKRRLKKTGEILN